ncbi:hypothetical protein FQN60_014951, partial [Etheostoma spectabile]
MMAVLICTMIDKSCHSSEANVCCPSCVNSLCIYISGFPSATASVLRASGAAVVRRLALLLLRVVEQRWLFKGFAVMTAKENASSQRSPLKGGVSEGPC